ncbi:MAG: hypothetical protein HYY48_00890 [Gammaproteobacteria bacterium]|nr:hypothetical protein [Gammaproteobacteria bacterium]
MAWPLDLFNPAPSPDEVQRQMRRILESPEFGRTTGLKELLEFVVSRALEGRLDCLTGNAIAAQVFQRGHSFDPETDSIVRTEAARLRGRLEEYYRQSGRRDRVYILLNRRDYLPVFVMRDMGVVSRIMDMIASYWRWFAAGAVAVLATLALYALF